MFVSRWRPYSDVWSEMHQLQSEMNRLFDRFGFRNGGPAAVASYPALNMWSDSDRLYIEAELPGMEPLSLFRRVRLTQRLQRSTTVRRSGRPWSRRSFC
jgi:HSP20 family molecular chaperone IbpA